MLDVRYYRHSTGPFCAIRTKGDSKKIRLLFNKVIRVYSVILGSGIDMFFSVGVSPMLSIVVGQCSLYIFNIIR